MDFKKAHGKSRPPHRADSLLGGLPNMRITAGFREKGFGLWALAFYWSLVRVRRGPRLVFGWGEMRLRSCRVSDFLGLMAFSSEFGLTTSKLGGPPPRSNSDYKGEWSSESCPLIFPLMTGWREP